MAPAVVVSSAIKYRLLANFQAIRLVILEPGSEDDPITCRLFHAELGHQDYEALSYEWGDASSTDPEITIDHTEVRIRQNLHDALWNLRLENDERCLWIDSMCINQSDVLERNHQVELMGKIYSQSKNTIAWLGVARNNSNDAMDKLLEFDGFLNSRGKEYIDLLVEGKGESSAYRPGKVYVQTTQLDAIIAMANRSYWSRMWIVQEIQLPKQLMLHCGAKSISPLSFFSFLEMATVNQGSYGYDLEGTLAFFLLGRRHDKKQSRKDTLHDWLSGCLAQPTSGLAKPFTCSEPRDMVYALLGVSSDCQNGELRPDYAKPLIDVYMDVYEIISRRAPKDAQYSSYDLEGATRTEYFPLQVENDLALRLGLMKKSRHSRNERKFDRVANLPLSHLLWPLGRFQLVLWDFFLWDVAVTIMEPVWATIRWMIYISLGVILNSLLALDYAWSKATGLPRRS